MLPITRFHARKHAHEAIIPRKARFTMTVGWEKTPKEIVGGKKRKYIIIESSP